MSREPAPVPLVRHFLPVPDESDPSEDQIEASFLVKSRTETWETLESQFRVVVLADAGAGKTHEMRARATRLRGDGKQAFFLRIEDMTLGFVASFEVGTDHDYREWQLSTEDAWFFLDSVDEAKLDSPLAFTKAIRRFADEIHDSKHRAHIILSSRPYAWAAKTDRKLVEDWLPHSAPHQDNNDGADDKGDASAARQREPVGDPAPSWKVLKLAPLNADDIRTFAAARGIPEIDALLLAIERTNLWSMAERPFDLDGIFEQWTPGEPLGSRLVILQHGIQRRLEEIDEARIDRQPLNRERALDGARQLAAAVTLTKQAGIRVPDGLRNQVGIDGSAVLADWEAVDIKALLSRALFNDAIYGAVRFRHREVRELLTAEWLQALINDGERRAVEALIFREKYGQHVVSPTMRPILAWLILFDGEIRARALALAPEIATEGGDTATLPLAERRALLAQIVERIGSEAEDRAVHHNEAIARIAQHDLAEDALALIKRYRDNDDAVFFLSRFVWQGELKTCTEALLPIAINRARRNYVRISSARAVLSVGTLEQRAQLWSGILAAPPPLDRRLLAELLSAEPPDRDTVANLLLAIDLLGPHDAFEASGLGHVLHQLIDRLDLAQMPLLVSGLNPVLGREPHIERGECAVSKAFAWLLGPVLHAAERLIEARAVAALDDSTLEVLIMVPAVRQWHSEDREHKTQLRELVPAWPAFNDRLYWADVRRARAHKVSKRERVTDDWPAAWVGPFWSFDASGFDRLLGYAADMPLLDDRLVALTRAFSVYRDADRPRKWRDRLHTVARGHEELSERLRALLRPPPSEARQKWKRQEREFRLRDEQRAQAQERSRRALVARLTATPDLVRHPPTLGPGDYSSDQHQLMCIVESSGVRRNRAEGANWRCLIADFGLPVAEAYRDAAIAHWRAYVPEIRSEGANTSSVPYSLLFGMVGLEIESRERADFPASLSENEVRHALRYVGWELNGLPRWLERMAGTFPQIGLDAIWKEMEWELTHTPADAPLHYMISDVIHHAPWMHAKLAPRLLEWLMAHDAPHSTLLRQCLHVLISGRASRDDLAALARTRISTAPSEHLPRWYACWVDNYPSSGIPAVTAWLGAFAEFAASSRAAQVFAVALQGGRGEGGPKAGAYRTARHLKALYSLVHRYVRSEEDIERVGKGVYSPGLRDEAQEARDMLSSQLAEIPGKATYTSLVELSEDHPAERHRRWMAERARLRAVTDADLEPWTERQIHEFDREAERSPTTPHQLFELGCARLLDFKDWLERGNDSPAQTYQRVESETEMRLLIAGWLNQQARRRYSIVQEPELANAQRADVWMQSPVVATPVPIEIKLVDNWSGPELCERLRNQLVGDYLRERRASAGIMLLIRQGRDLARHWQINSERRAFPALADSLQAYWETIARGYPDVEEIQVIGVDLTLRAERSRT